MKLKLVDEAGYTVNQFEVPPVHARVQWEILMFNIQRSVEDYRESVTDEEFRKAEEQKR